MVTIFFLGLYTNETQFHFLKNAIKDAFSNNGVHLKLVLFVDEKKMPEHLVQSQFTTFLSRADLNLLKKWKSPLAKDLLKQQPELLISTLIDAPVFLENFIKESSAQLKLGPEMANKELFDIAIVQEKPDLQELFAKSVKYLRKLK